MWNRLGGVGVLVAVTIGISGCTPKPPAIDTAAGDAAFRVVVDDVLNDLFRRHPSTATDLGVHTFDSAIEDYSAAAVAAEIASTKAFRERLRAIAPEALSAPRQLDREQLLHAMDASLLQDDVIKPWARDPDVYSSGLTRTAYVMIKRRFAPTEERLAQLVARLDAMPAVLLEARRNLQQPPRVYTQIAIDQLDGNRAFFRTAVLEAFPDVKDAALHRTLAASVDRVVAALGDYKTWLQKDLLPRSTGSFAYGEATYRARLEAEEMITLPLDRILTMAEADLRKNQAAFADTARKIDPSKTPSALLDMITRDHPPASRLLSTTQQELDAIARFLSEHGIVTIPEAVSATVAETPPFMRATTTASMDIPGPYEKLATEAYYNMTLPDPSWPKATQDEFMSQWYYPAITNVSVHEVWPGHYLQFLYLKSQTSDVRKVFGTASNSEGWAHYVEQMMIDEGFHADDPRYRLAQLQDALLRDVRCIVGIRMHTQGMSVEEAAKMFEREAYQPAPVAESEAKRGTSDATYGYYTLGKLMILKLRDDYRAKMGSAYTLRGFHDAFIANGPIALPLVRKAMLGADAGEPF